MNECNKFWIKDIEKILKSSRFTMKPHENVVFLNLSKNIDIWIIYKHQSHKKATTRNYALNVYMERFQTVSTVQ